MKYLKILLLKLFVRSADDIISFLDGVEDRIRELAIKAESEAAELALQAETLRHEAGIIRENAIKAHRLADRIKA